MTFKIRVRIIMGALAIASSLVGGAASAESAKKIIDAAISPIYPPFEFKDPASNQLTGFDYDLLNAIAEKAGMTVNWVETAYEQLGSFAPLKTKRVDIYGSAMSDTPERRKTGVSFIDYAYEPWYFYTLKANADKFRSLDALCGKRIATTRSSTMQAGLVTKWSEANCTGAGKSAVVLVSSDNTAQSRLMLKQDRVDAGIIGAGALEYSNRVEGTVFMSIGKPLFKNMFGMAFINEELGQSLKKALDELIADGGYVKLLHKWDLPVEDSSIGQATINAGPSLPHF